MTSKILSSSNTVWLWCACMLVPLYMCVPVCVYTSSAFVSMSVCLDVPVFSSLWVYSCTLCTWLYVSPVCTQCNKVEAFPEWALPGRRLTAYKAVLWTNKFIVAHLGKLELLTALVSRKSIHCWVARLRLNGWHHHPVPHSHSKPDTVLCLGDTDSQGIYLIFALLGPSLEQPGSSFRTCLPLGGLAISVQLLPVCQYKELDSLFLQGDTGASVEYPPPDAVSVSHTPEPFIWLFVSQKPRSLGVEAVPKNSAQWLMGTGWREVQKRLWRVLEDHSWWKSTCLADYQDLGSGSMTLIAARDGWKISP